MKERDHFIQACFAENLEDFYKQWIKQKKDREQFFEHGQHKYWKPSNICCESGEVLTRDTIGVKVGYWTPFIWKPIRKDLLLESKKYEASECHKIDCSCNDCIALDREDGYCEVKKKNVNISPNTCCPENQGCFIYRR